MHPLLFEIPVPWGTLPIFAYGVMLGLSLILGYQVVLALGKRDGLPAALLGDVYFTTAIAGVIGARLLYVATNFEDLTPKQWLDIRSGGLVAYGGFLSGFAAALVHLRARRASLLAFGDVAAPAVALGLVLTRLGCYLYGCDFGARLSEHAPVWLQRLGTFPNWADTAAGLGGSPAFLHHVDVYGLAGDATHSFPVHPTQLYEALLGVVLFVITFAAWRARRFQGQALLVLAMGYALGRFGLEGLRDDPERGMLLGFSTSQVISLVLLPVAATAYSMLARRAREQSAQRA
jgi:phosphatidylglycerol---prolipoprotein diacylglyceryl transferase